MRSSRTSDWADVRSRGREPVIRWKGFSSGEARTFAGEDASGLALRCVARNDSVEKNR